MVGGDDQQVVGAERGDDRGRAGASKRSRLAAKPPTSLRCPYWLSKSTRLTNTSPRAPVVERRLELIEAVGVAARSGATWSMPRPANRSPTFPIAVTGTPAAVSRSSSVSRGGGIAKSWRLAVRVKRAGRADERPGDDPADAQPLDRQLVGDPAPGVELRRPARRPRARQSGTRCRPRCRRSDAPVLQVLLAERVDDRGARGDDVAEHGAADAGREGVDERRPETRAERSETGARAPGPSAPSAR